MIHFLSCIKLQATSFPKSRPSPDGINHRKKKRREIERSTHCQIAKVSLYLQNQVTPNWHHIKHNNESWRKLHTAYFFQIREGSFILVLHVKIAVIQSLRACSHEPGTVNYPGVMIAPGQELPCVHMMVCCPGATLPRVNFIAPGQVHRHLITTKLSEFL